MIAEIITGTLSLTAIGLGCSLLLHMAARQYKAIDNEVVELILRELPQTQCGQCGYPGCRPYAEAIYSGEAINRCPPGGDQTLLSLSRLLGRPARPLDTSGGDGIARLAFIREQDCIGCALCLPACPVDAIIGAPQLLHSVISDACTGCELCLAPCPVDCIDMLRIDDQHGAVADANPISDPCIRCGDCITACPKDLAPLQLYLHDDSLDLLDSLRLTDCIECGLCDRVCPSNIPLTTTFSAAKLRLAQRNDDSERAALVASRVDQHEHRQLQRSSIESRPASSADLLARLRSQNQADD